MVRKIGMFPEASDLWKSGKAEPIDSKWQRRVGAGKFFEVKKKRRERIKGRHKPFSEFL